MKLVLSWLFYAYLLYLFVPLLWKHGDVLIGLVVICLLGVCFKPSPDAA